MNFAGLADPLKGKKGPVEDSGLADDGPAKRPMPVRTAGPGDVARLTRLRWRRGGSSPESAHSIRGGTLSTPAGRLVGIRLRDTPAEQIGLKLRRPTSNPCSPKPRTWSGRAAKATSGTRHRPDGQCGAFVPRKTSTYAHRGTSTSDAPTMKVPQIGDKGHGEQNGSMGRKSPEIPSHP